MLYLWFSLFQKKRRLKHLNVNENDHVLDLGCGEGYDISILRSIGISKIIGIDISKKYLREAKVNNPHTKLILGSAYKLPFKDNSFDCILVDGVFHHLAYKKKAIENIKRVLKRGGNLYFIEPRPHFLRHLVDVLSNTGVSKYIPGLRGRAIYYITEAKEMNFWLNEVASFLGELEKAGFKRDYVRNDFLSIIGEFVKQ